VASPVLTEEAVSFFTMAGSVEVLTPTSDAAAASGSVPTMVTAAAAAAQTCKANCFVGFATHRSTSQHRHRI